MTNVEGGSEKQEVRANDHLANERTFLAWIRTSIAVIGLGFVVVKFSLFIKQLSAVLGETAVLPGKGYSPVIGILLVAIGGIITLLAFFRYRRIERKLLSNQYYPSFSLSLFVTVAIVIVSVLLLLYLASGI